MASVYFVQDCGSHVQVLSEKQSLPPTPSSPKSKMEPREGPKYAIFIPWIWEGGHNPPSRFSKARVGFITCAKSNSFKFNLPAPFGPFPE